MRQLYRIIMVFSLGIFCHCFCACSVEDNWKADKETPHLVPKQLEPLLSGIYNSHNAEIDDDETDLTEIFFDSIRNNYSYYRLFFSDLADDKADNKENIGTWTTFAHTIMLYYFSIENNEKALDFWFKIKNNFSFNYMLLMDYALCRIQIGDFSATSDLAFVFEMMFNAGLINDYLSSEAISSIKLLKMLKRVKDYLLRLASDACFNKGNYEVYKNYYLLLDQQNLHNKLMLAICYNKMAEGELKTDLHTTAETIFRDIIRQEDSIGKYDYTPYAYLFLDEPDKSVAVIKHIIKTDLPLQAISAEDSICCFNIHCRAAEIYAQVGKLKKAEHHIKKAFEYNHAPTTLVIAHETPLLAPIHAYVEQEINWYYDMGVSNSRIHKDTIMCDIAFSKRNNDHIRTVSCKINGNEVKDILFDPGADKIQLTQAKAEEIGITTDDIIGTVKTKSANGVIVKKQLVSLKKVEIGVIVLENVQAYIDENNNAPLLLGCTVWNNLKVEMPSPVNKGMIRLTYIKESVEIPEKRTIDTDKQ